MKTDSLRDSCHLWLQKMRIHAERRLLAGFERGVKMGHKYFDIGQ